MHDGGFPPTATRIGINRGDIFKPRLLIEQLLEIGDAANLRELLLLLAHPLLPVLQEFLNVLVPILLLLLLLILLVGNLMRHLLEDLLSDDGHWKTQGHWLG